jgi:hypothetical protein
VDSCQRHEGGPASQDDVLLRRLFQLLSVPSSPFNACLARKRAMYWKSENTGAKATSISADKSTTVISLMTPRDVTVS